MDKNFMGKDITMYHLVQIVLDITRDVQELKTFVQLSSVKHYERLTEDMIQSRQVMTILKIKKGTLQKLRDNKTLLFTRFRGKIYYKTADVIALLKSNNSKVNNKR